MLFLQRRYSWFQDLRIKLIYYSSYLDKQNEFENHLTSFLKLEVMSQVHWYLATWINQLANHDINIDQSQYCMTIMKEYLKISTYA
jgi:hypothetical protein